MESRVTAWLLEGDPAVRWQVRRYLLGEDGAVDRARVAEEGWGAALLANQDPEGTWANGLYSPKWTSTTYTLLMLRRLGLSPGHPQAITGCRRLLDDARYVGGGVSYWKTHREPETCVNGLVLSIVEAFGFADPRVAGIAGCLLEDQMDDGGWNCLRPRGATHSSFHTTINVLEGLLEHQRRTPSPEVANAMERGREFLNVHGMYRSHRTGEVIDPKFARMPFSPRWHFDILRGLGHYADAGADPDPRLEEVVEIVRSRRDAEGRWPVTAEYSGKMWIRPERAGRPSRWNTMRALRILTWWEGASRFG